MRIKVANLGPNDLRVIIDGDNVHDYVLKAGIDDEYESDAEGVIEFRELGNAEE